MRRLRPEFRNVNRRRAAVVVSLALLAVYGCTYNPAPKWMHNPRYAGCTSAELRIISHAFIRAARLSESALDAVQAPANRRRAENGAWDAYSWWFGEFAPHRFALVQSVFAATRREFERTVSIQCGEKTVNCPRAKIAESTLRRRSEDPDRYGPEFEGDRPPGREWQEFAYANHLIPVVQLCTDFFLQEASDQAAILLHELTHVSSDTVDYAYTEPALLALARNDPEQAVRNAANYAAFAETVDFGRIPGGRGTRSDDPE
jgi:hypothetical protein